MSSAPLRFMSCCSSQATVALSIWLVGSSRIKRSLGRTKTLLSLLMQLAVLLSKLATRAHYRQCVARLARRTGRTEIEIAGDVLARAQSSEGARRHVGWFLLREVLGAPEKRRDGGWYIAAVVVGTLFLSLLLGFATKSVSGAVLLLIPVSEVVKGLLVTARLVIGIVLILAAVLLTVVGKNIHFNSLTRVVSPVGRVLVKLWRWKS